MATHNPSYDQDSFRFRNDDGSETAATWAEAQGTNITLEKGANRAFRLRIQVAQTVTNANTALSKTFKVRRSIGGGAYADVGAQGTSTPVRYRDSTHVTHQGTTTEQLAGAFGFVTGRIDEQGVSGTVAFTDSARSETEVEFSLEIVDSLVSADDTIDFRVYETSNTALNVYTTTPRVTVAAAPAAPSTPTISAAALDSESIRLTQGAGSGATSHTLHRSTTSGFTPGGGNEVASFGATPTSPHDDTGLDPSTTYYYVLRATNATGSTDSTQTSATTEAAATDPRGRWFHAALDVPAAASGEPAELSLRSGQSQSAIVGLHADALVSLRSAQAQAARAGLTTAADVALRSSQAQASRMLLAADAIIGLRAGQAQSARLGLAVEVPAEPRGRWYYAELTVPDGDVVPAELSLRSAQGQAARVGLLTAALASLRSGQAASARAGLASDALVALRSPQGQASRAGLASTADVTLRSGQAQASRVGLMVEVDGAPRGRWFFAALDVPDGDTAVLVLLPAERPVDEDLVGTTIAVVIEGEPALLTLRSAQAAAFRGGLASERTLSLRSGQAQAGRLGLAAVDVTALSLRSEQAQAARFGLVSERALSLRSGQAQAFRAEITTEDAARLSLRSGQAQAAHAAIASERAVSLRSGQSQAARAGLSGQSNIRLRSGQAQAARMGIVSEQSVSLQLRSGQAQAVRAHLSVQSDIRLRSGQAQAARIQLVVVPYAALVLRSAQEQAARFALACERTIRLRSGQAQAFRVGLAERPGPAAYIELHAVMTCELEFDPVFTSAIELRAKL